MFRFRIDPSTGQIITKMAIDREDTYGGVCTLLAVATEKTATEGRRTTAHIFIAIMDENDNVPKFSSTSYVTFIYEGSIHSDFVAVTVCNDSDVFSLI